MNEIKNLMKRFEELQERLEAIEGAIPLAAELVNISERLNIPLNLYRDQLKQLVVLNGIRESIPEIEKDYISRLIIQLLLSKPNSNISRITANVRQLKGKASRRIIAERLEKLEKLGIAEHKIGRNNEKLFQLRTHGKKVLIYKSSKQ